MYDCVLYKCARICVCCVCVLYMCARMCAYIRVCACVCIVYFSIYVCVCSTYVAVTTYVCLCVHVHMACAQTLCARTAHGCFWRATATF